ncbi:MAG: DUF697 domain-containing protein [Thiomicrorhabdus sp.]|nr:DUF697 domain-containing protein [Thiomicrorhabdus sp.]
MDPHQKPPPYRSKITQTPLTNAQPEQPMPQKEVDIAHYELKKTSPLWLLTLGLGILCFVSFSLFQAIHSLLFYVNSYPILASGLALILATFTLTLMFLIYREIKGYLSVNHFITHKIDLAELASHSNKEKTLKTLKQHALTWDSSSFARYCYQRFEGALNSDLSHAEIIQLYQQNVADPVLKQAESVLKKESFISGGLAFISPNAFIQTLLIFWVSMRTIKRIAAVFGLRPSVSGNWKLIKIVAENIAAQSFLELATDEMTQQIGSSLAAKFMENTAEGLAASALNVRLGRALINQLKNSPPPP